MHRTAGRSSNIIPNIGASGPSEYFKQVLGVPVMWIPHSYGGCGQHGPDEHALGSLFCDGLGLMAGVFWDISEQGRPAWRTRQLSDHSSSSRKQPTEATGYANRSSKTLNNPGPVRNRSSRRCLPRICSRARRACPLPSRIRC